MTAGEVRLVEVAATPLASVHLRTTRDGIATTIRTGTDAVWAFLRGPDGGGLRPGHNVVVYRPGGPDEPGELAMEVGVQVDRPFTGEGGGGVACRATPSGLVVTTTHVGPYQRLGEANRRLHAFVAATHGLHATGTSWEIYGDWVEDVERLETEVLLSVERRPPD